MALALSKNQNTARISFWTKESFGFSTPHIIIFRSLTGSRKLVKHFCSSLIPRAQLGVWSYSIYTTPCPRVIRGDAICSYTAHDRCMRLCTCTCRELGVVCDTVHWVCDKRARRDVTREYVHTTHVNVSKAIHSMHGQHGTVHVCI